MALVWQQFTRHKHYQVRRAGASTRLYTDGVFHSQFNPNHPLNGSIWDLLVLPALFAPRDIHRILILGLGGGAVVRTIEKILPGRDITAVEIDPVHIRIAKTYFGVSTNRQTKVIQADAAVWLAHYQGDKFDFILDDLFIGAEGAPSRAVNADQNWCNLLLKHLSSKGVLAINFDSNKALRNSTLAKQFKGSQALASGFTLSCPGYENRIVAFFKTVQQPEKLNRTLRELAACHGKPFIRKIKARVRRL